MCKQFDTMISEMLNILFQTGRVSGTKETGPKITSLLPSGPSEADEIHNQQLIDSEQTPGKTR